METSSSQRILATVRLSLGLIFLWAFLDKLFGLGFSTSPEKSWLAGTSPTAGYLQFGTQGPLAGVFQAVAGSAAIDWLFMAGLAGIGLALTLGIALKLARISGIAMMLLIYASLFPPEHHPVIDEHIVYALILGLIPPSRAGETWGLGAWWANLPFVRRFPLFG